MPLKWQSVGGPDDTSGLSRAEVSGGWLYAVVGRAQADSRMVLSVRELVFVPDPAVYGQGSGEGGKRP